MPESILVVEYEPRYTDRVKQALAGQQLPKLIVLSSVVPKVSTSELIRAIRGRNNLAHTPILLTVSGYTGKSPRQDAQRMGASDILPKPYSEAEFLGKVQQMLGVAVTASVNWSAEAEGQLTSNEIFGDLLDDDRAVTAATRKVMKPKDDVDKMLADTLAGVMPSKRTVPGNTAFPNQPAPPRPVAPPPSAESVAKAKTASDELDKM